MVSCLLSCDSAPCCWLSCWRRARPAHTTLAPGLAGASTPVASSTFPSPAMCSAVMMVHKRAVLLGKARVVEVELECEAVRAPGARLYSYLNYTAPSRTRADQTRGLTPGASLAIGCHLHGGGGGAPGGGGGTLAAPPASLFFLPPKANESMPLSPARIENDATVSCADFLGLYAPPHPTQ